MACLSNKLMDEVWKKVGVKSVDQIRAMQKVHQKDQKALTKFVYRHLFELPEDAAGVGIYAFHVIVEAFSGVTPRPKTVRRPAIEHAWELPAGILTEKALAAEPHVVRYLEDALAEEDDEVVLTETERAQCSRVIQTAILCLHGACKKIAELREPN